ncbi:MAG: COG1361 S-layer family protein [Candidatus Bathyarchaeia archaeon]
MSRKISPIILSICLLLLFVMKHTQPAIAHFNYPLLVVDVTGYNLTAGDENEMSISIQNIDGDFAYNVRASLTVPSTVSGISIVKESNAMFEKIHYKEIEWMHPILYVSRDCPLGAYSLTLNLEYTDPADERHIDSVQIGVFVDAVKPSEVYLSVEVEDYHNLTAGTEDEIKIAVTNVGEEAVYDVEAMLTSTSSSIVVLRELSYLFDVIGINSSVHFTPVLGVSRNTPLGAYSLTLTLKYKDPDGVSYSDSLVIGVLVDSVEPTERTRIAIQDFKVTPTEVFVGDELTVEMDLKNWGANAHDVQVQLTIDSQSPFVSLDPTLVFVGDLRSNQTVKVIYNLRISGDADADLYVLQLVISYYDVDDQPDSLTEAISIGVHSIVDFRLLDIQPSIVTAELGETVTIEADLLLLGTETVEFVEVEIVENRPFISVPESYEYIGRVDPDSPVLFTIQFMVDPNATSGSYTLQMKVSCWDTYNQQRDDIIDLPVVVNEFSNQNEETGPTLWDIIWTIIRILFGVKP